MKRHSLYIAFAVVAVVAAVVMPPAVFAADETAQPDTDFGILSAEAEGEEAETGGSTPEPGTDGLMRAGG